MRSRHQILRDLTKGGFLIDPDDEVYVSETIQLAEAAGKLEWSFHTVISRLPNRPLTLRRGFRPWPKPTPPGYAVTKDRITPSS